MTLEEIIKKIYKTIFKSEKFTIVFLSTLISYEITNLIVSILDVYLGLFDRYDAYKEVFLYHDFFLLYNETLPFIFYIFSHGEIEIILFFLILIVIFILSYKFIGKKISTYIVKRLKGDDE
jgi:hypothetical protein